ncbi:MAG: hypothetical protein WD294_09650 [Phycisphaeraceae bacterium]
MAKLVPVYRGLTTDDAQRLADYLDERGIEAYVDSTQSPLYGMSQGPSAHVVYVDEHISGYGRDLVRQFSREWHAGVAKDEVDREDTGWEVPTHDRPSDDAMVDSTQDQDRAYGPDFLQEEDIESYTRESAEVEDLIDETGHESFTDRIVRFGTDHDVAEEEDYSAIDDALDSDIDEAVDQADTRQGMDEQETRPTDFVRRTRYDKERYDKEDEG